MAKKIVLTLKERLATAHTQTVGGNAFRTMTKQEFFKEVEDIKSDKLLITDSVDNVNEEIKNNCWAISINDELTKEISVDELATFLKEVKNDRQQQLRQ